MEFRAVLIVALCTTVVWARAPSKIQGGVDANNYEFPFLVSIQIRGHHHCGGAILDSTHILTAAHCVVEDGAPIAGLEVITGVMTYKSRNNDNVFSVIKINYPDGFLTSNTWKDDIAILTLSKAIPFNVKQSPVRLATRDVVSGSTAVLSGWGAAEFRGVQTRNVDRLQKIEMKVLSYNECRSRMGKIMTGGYLCAFAGNNRGACVGDSGGPLVYNGEVIGISAFVDPCGKGRPDAFTRVYHYLSWIRHAMNY